MQHVRGRECERGLQANGWRVCKQSKSFHEASSGCMHAARRYARRRHRLQRPQPTLCALMCMPAPWPFSLPTISA